MKLGRYEIIRTIGRGSMGIVYLAHDPVIDRQVAIKTILTDFLANESRYQEFRKRFLREARTAGKLNHPNILTIYDIGEQENMLFLAMEYIEGQTLKQVLQHDKHLDMDTIFNLLVQIASALTFAHSHAVIHRDIKPENIMLLSDMRSVRIMDFGIAKTSDSKLTKTGVTLGTPSYMSPEQILGREITYKSDIFSLGVLTYELIAGHKPFEASSITSVIYKIIREEPPAIPKQALGDYPGLQPVIMQALAKDPDKRWQTANAFVQALQAEYRPMQKEQDDDIEAMLRSMLDDLPSSQVRATIPIDQEQLQQSTDMPTQTETDFEEVPQAQSIEPARFVYLLAVTSGPMAGQSFPLEPGQEIRIGRAQTEHPHIQILDPTVSRLHCIVLIDSRSGAISIQNCSHTNYTQVNDQRIESQRISENDTVSIGETAFCIEKRPDPSA